MADRKEAYQQALMGGRIGFGTRPALAVINFQKRYTCSEDHDAITEIHHANRLIAMARKTGMKVIFINQKSACEESYDQLDERMHREFQDTVIYKQWPSIYFGTGLIQSLIADRIDTMILCGYSASGSIYVSSMYSTFYGMRTLVAKDTVWDPDEKKGELFLWNIEQKFADVINTQDILEHYLNQGEALTLLTADRSLERGVLLETGK